MTEWATHYNTSWALKMISRIFIKDGNKYKFAPFCELDAKSDHCDAWCAHIAMLAQFSHFQFGF